MTNLLDRTVVLIGPDALRVALARQRVLSVLATGAADEGTAAGAVLARRHERSDGLPGHRRVGVGLGSGDGGRGEPAGAPGLAVPVGRVPAGIHNKSSAEIDDVLRAAGVSLAGRRFALGVAR
jgi:hypothetical protein